ncbi:MAG: hypothetical protein ACJAYU_004061 [Bradymonadia bacterium]|jgi:hypothetical protein
MNRLLLPIATLALLCAACSDDVPTDPSTTDLGADTTDIGLDIPIEEDGGECVPDCAGRECGDDSCEGSCGECAANSDCTAGVCVDNTPVQIDCIAIIQCINQATTQQDFNDCVAQGTPEAQDQINAIVDCVQTNCADPDLTEDEALACQQEECSAELNTCQGIGVGSETCEEVVDCLLGCSTADCQNACVSAGTEEAQDEAIAGFNCAAEICGEVASQEEFFTCFEENCPEEYNSCYDISVVEDPTCETYCASMEDACSGTYVDGSACLAYCETAGAFPAGTADDTSGNTIGCRIYHAGVAAGLEGDENATHCGHAGPSGGDVCGTWCDNYCDLALNTCDGDNSLYADGEECLTACGEFSADGAAGDAGGDTVQCRVYHLGVAGSNGEASASTHCPHGGIDGGGVCVDEVTPDDPTCEAYCSIMGDACGGEYLDSDACLNYCESAGAFPVGTNADTSGNTIGCRIYHAGVASGLEGDENALHCGHAGPSGGGVCGTWCENYCDLALNTCTGDNELFPDGDECLAACGEFSDGGAIDDAAGDTVQCRVYHLGVAGSDGETSAATHCPHGGTDGAGVCTDE